MASGNLSYVRLRHGTTKQRADSILQNGPDVGFMEPGGTDAAGGFSTAPALGPYALGSPSQYALGKAQLFPKEGGPAVIEMEVPESIARLGIDAGGEIRFEPGYGLDELRDAWPLLVKRILPP